MEYGRTGNYPTRPIDPVTELEYEISLKEKESHFPCYYKA
jgi:hypothetical protein